MIVRFAASLALSFAMACVPAALRADDLSPDPDLPQPFDAAAFLPMLKHSPFNRVVDYTDTLQLTGVAWVDGKPMATFMDRQTKKQIVVSDEPNESGWHLAEVSMATDLHDAEIKLQVGAEVFAFHYSEAQINPVTTTRSGIGQPQAATVTKSSRNEKVAGSTSDSSAYLSEADREYYRKGMSKEARDKFRDSMRSHQDRMEKMTDSQRASYSQKIFNKIKAQEQGIQPQPKTKKVRK